MLRYAYALTSCRIRRRSDVTLTPGNQQLCLLTCGFRVVIVSRFACELRRTYRLNSDAYHIDLCCGACVRVCACSEWFSHTVRCSETTFAFVDGRFMIINRGRRKHDDDGDKVKRPQSRRPRCACKCTCSTVRVTPGGRRRCQRRRRLPTPTSVGAMRFGVCTYCTVCIFYAHLLYTIWRGGFSG